ncbi:MAG: hypothetical protein KGQ70_09810, partial [Alphaproteobacteria bacterium]|nr:hypothetical protein [Alphaproteobacteria bacterium]
MTEKGTPARKKPACARRRGRRACAAAFLVLFLIGYNLTAARLQRAGAQTVTAPQPVTGNAPP